jgi:hypothetical protein
LPNYLQPHYEWIRVALKTYKVLTWLASMIHKSWIVAAPLLHSSTKQYQSSERFLSLLHDASYLLHCRHTHIAL